MGSHLSAHLVSWFERGDLIIPRLTRLTSSSPLLLIVSMPKQVKPRATRVPESTQTALERSAQPPTNAFLM